ncbi:hypothetical protein N8I77_005267 [Diaporthe amygdali]|uniref:Uncharacterized protein n=1 Tax=Phomopsis amygdali TaxID=1214568 RepID=A0AAD9SDP3_PHOAM|nr:hypothetical protein N8I77_005267 [Diaporthe amygdali]
MSTADISPQIQHIFQTHSGGLKSLGFLFATLTLAIYILRQWALPKPIPGIPHRADAISSILGDFMTLGRYIASGDVTFFDWLTLQAKELDSPIFQIFTRPLGRPIVVVNDFRETQDILMRRGKEFDRSFIAIDIFKGIVPNHHIVQKTNATWKGHRRLLQDLMSPGFLEGVAAPVIYHHVSNLVRLWEIKTNIARGRPFTASGDIYNTALDAVHGFAYGKGFEHHAIKQTLEFYERLQPKATEELRSKGGIDEPIEFPIQETDELIKSVITITSTFAEVMGSPIAGLKWPVLMRMPKLVKAKEIRDECIRKEIEKAVKRGQTHPDGSIVRSAVDNMVYRETVLAEKEGRASDFFSTTMFDEIFGFVIAGHDTTSTTFSWGVKFLADNPEVQTRLRSALQAHFSLAKSEKRAPTVEEIISARIPYLEATEEEILRCAPTVQSVDREAVVDTVILGHKVPKGTLIMMPSGGASLRSPGFDIDEASRHSSSQDAKKSGKARPDWDPMDIGAFKPERWLVNDGKDFDAASGPQLAFSLGTRGCFGKRLAYLQMRMLVTLIVWNFELSRCPDQLSSYGHKMTLTTEPTQCFVRLSKVEL